MENDKEQTIKAQRAGLCATCKYSKVIESNKGNRFVMCLLSKADPSFPKYPPLPVLACTGYVKSTAIDET